jgi:hypothetical protein
MRKMMVGGAALLAAAATLHAQAPNKLAAEKQLIANETAVNEAIAKHDLAGFKKHVPSESWAVDPGGPMQVADLEKNFAQLKVEPGWKIDQSKVVWIDDNTAVHMYRWTGKGSYLGQPFGDTYSSTVWTNRGGSWVALFHQETPIPPPPAAPAKK